MKFGELAKSKADGTLEREDVEIAEQDIAAEDQQKLGNEGKPEQVRQATIVQRNIADIHVQDRLREIDQSRVKDLAESIKKIGLLQPILIDSNDNLIAGEYRLCAMELLQQATIDCIISDKVDAIDLKLQQIDENLIRVELSPVDRAEFIRQRKEAYEEKYPPAKVGDTGNPRSRANNGTFTTNAESASVVETMPTFVEDTSQVTGQSPRSIQVDLQIANNLTDEAKGVLKEKNATQQQALIVARQKPTTQATLVANIQADPDKSLNVVIQETIPEAKPKPKPAAKPAAVKPAPKPKTKPTPPPERPATKMIWGDPYKILANTRAINPESADLVIASLANPAPGAIGKIAKLAKRCLKSAGIALILGEVSPAVAEEIITSCTKQKEVVVAPFDTGVVMQVAAKLKRVAIGINVDKFFRAAIIEAMGENTFTEEDVA